MTLSTKEQRRRTPILLLDEKLEAIRTQYTDELRYDQRSTNAGMAVRHVAWRLGNAEFLVTYHEVREVPGTATFRVRTQPAAVGHTPDAWVEIPSLGELDALLRAAKKEKGLRACDVRALEKSRKHEGETPEGLILVGLTGSRAYGLEHEGYPDPETGDWVPASDTDVRGVFVVPTREVLSLTPHRALTEQRDADACYDEIQRFLELCLNANPERLEMLASPKTHVTPEGQWLVDHQRIFLSKAVVKTYGGYAKQQLYRIASKQRRTKPAMHLIRLLITGVRILREGVVDCDMRDYRDRLLAIRQGEMALEEVFAWHRELEAEFARAAETTRLPDEPDRAKADEILLSIRRDHLAWE